MIAIGIIGCGAWGPNHIRVFSGLPSSRVVAAADVDEERLRRVHDLYPGLRCERDYARLLSDRDVEAVVVATPTSTHYTVVRDALEAGKHVLSEKPLAETSAQAEELVASARERGLALMVGHVFLFNAGIAKLKEILDAGSLGDPLYLSAIRTNLGPIRRDVNASYDLAAHDVSIFNWLLGAEPEIVSATGASFLQPEIEDVVAISLKYPAGVLATIQASWLNPKKVRQITVVGKSAMMLWDDLELSNPVALYDKRAEATQEYSDYGEFLRIAMSDGDVRLPKIELEEPLRAQGRVFLENVQSPWNRHRADGEAAIAVVRALEAIQRSLKADGAPVRLEVTTRA